MEDANRGVVAFTLFTHDLARYSAAYGHSVIGSIKDESPLCAETVDRRP